MVRPGNGFFALIGGYGLTGSTGFVALRPLERRYRILVYLPAAAPENIRRLANPADGAAYPAIRPEAIGATVIAVAGNPVATGLSLLISPAFARIVSNKRLLEPAACACRNSYPVKSAFGLRKEQSRPWHDPRRCQSGPPPLGARAHGNRRRQAYALDL